MIPHNKPNIGIDEINAVMECMQNNILTSGEIVSRFEEDFMRYIGMHSIATSSGTHALHLALSALDISDGDEVIVPTFTCPSVALPIIYQRAKPLLCDIDFDFNISLESIEKICTKSTKAIIVPHMLGYPAKIKEIKEFCDDNDLYLIEDCAQSIGSEYDHKKVGTFGDISCFSFYATKMLSSIKGGMVCTNNSEILSSLNENIFSDRPQSDNLNSLREDDLKADIRTGVQYIYPMSDIEAAVGRVQLRKLDDIISKRRKIADRYISELKYCELPLEDSLRRHVYMRFVIETKRNNLSLLKELNNKQVSSTIIHVPMLHQRKLFESSTRNQSFPVAESKLSKLLSIPIFPTMSDDELSYTIDVLNSSLK